MSWTLGGVDVTPPPGGFTRDQIEIKAEHNLISGKTVQDIFAQKERYTIRLTKLTETEANNLIDQFDDKTTKTFAVSETNLTISTTVLVSIQRLDYNTPGGDLRVDLSLVLTEET